VKLKLDENIDTHVVTFLCLAGHDVATVPGQRLTSAPDEEVIEVCRSEGRALVTCDRGFGNRLKYNPSNYSGIVIIRLPSRHKFTDWREAIEILIAGLEQTDVIGKLWIIQQGRIMEYQGIEDEEEDL
jgi:predicted nuclease of predicted toxin-antitoxin system